MFEFEYAFFNNREDLAVSVWTEKGKREEIKWFKHPSQHREIEEYLQDLESRYQNMIINRKPIFEGLIVSIR
jgi:hypothetical protein